MTRSLRVALVAAGLAGLLAGAPRVARAQCAGASCTITINLTPAYVARLTLSTTSTSFAAPTESDYTAGFKAATGPTVTAKINAAYHVTVDVAPGTTKWTYAPVSGLSDPNKPPSDLKWATTAGGSFSNNVGTAATLLSGASGTSGTVQAIFFRAALSYAVDRPGTYALTVRYTLSAP